jgi:predicted nucleic acid-binding protein
VTRRLVVSDTSPIRVLHHLSQLTLLRKFFEEVLVPPSVARELESPRSNFVPISLAAVPSCRIEIPRDSAAIHELERELETGEAEAIVLAKENMLRVFLLMNVQGGWLPRGSESTTQV